MKKFYDEPELELIRLGGVDIITTSLDKKEGIQDENEVYDD